MPRPRPRSDSSSASSWPTGPLKLDPAEVRRVGVVRAAIDATRHHPAVVASGEAARLEGNAAFLAQCQRAGKLARETAEAYGYTDDEAPALTSPLADYSSKHARPAPF